MFENKIGFLTDNTIDLPAEKFDDYYRSKINSLFHHPDNVRFVYAGEHNDKKNTKKFDLPEWFITKYGKYFYDVDLEGKEYNRHQEIVIDPTLKILKSTHHFLENTTLYYNEHGLNINRREWLEDKNINSAGPTMTIYNSDSKEFVPQDFYCCFNLLATERSEKELDRIESESKLISNILSTKLPLNFTVADTYDKINKYPKTYEDLFNIVGSKFETIKFQGRNINGYPDSCWLTVDYNKNSNTFSYNYSR